MYLDHLIHERDVADEQHVQRRDQRMQPRRHFRHTQILILLVLALCGLYLFAHGHGVGKGNSSPPQHALPGQTSVQAGFATRPGASPVPGMGAGATCAGYFGYPF